MTYKEKLLDPRWQKKRLEIMKRDEFTCQWCLDTESTLHIHHFYYAKSRNPWDTSDDGLITLCENCHKFHHIKSDIVIEDLFCLLIVNPKKNKEVIRLIVLLALEHNK